MDELDKGLALALQGQAADNALQRFRAQAETWQVALPAVEPLVLDFGLGEYERYGLIEYWIANEAPAGYCGKYLFVFDSQTCPCHSHVRKHETFFIVHGAVEMALDEERHVLNAGDVLPVPPGRRHSFTGRGPALLLELSTPCEISDNCFVDKRIPLGREAE